MSGEFESALRETLTSVALEAANEAIRQQRLTNGDLMRIAEVDTPVLHGWMYLNRELPEEALQKLRDHFVSYRSSEP